MAKYVEYFLKTVLLLLSGAAITCAQVPRVQHVVIVLEENTDYADICGPNNTSMPFLCGLKSQGSISANYYAATHPSIGNYNDLVWGKVTTNDDSCDPQTCGFPYSADNIVRELDTAFQTWKGYAENLPSTCYFGGDNGNFAVRHSPIAYISDVQANCLNRYVAFEDPNLGFANDLAKNTLPNYAFITPNLCDDAHDCTLPGSSTPDQWLRNNVLQPLLNGGHLDPTTGDTVVIVTFDESGSDSTNGGGLVYWFMIGKGVKQNYQSTGPGASPGFYSHESTLRVMAEMLGANFTGLGGAASAPDMAEFFGTGTTPRLPVAVLNVTPQAGTAPLQVIEDSSASSDPNGGITSRSIDFGDGTISNAVTATHTYNTAGTFTVNLSVADNLGLTSTTSKTVTVQSPPTISVTVLPASAVVVSGGPQQFTAAVANTTNQTVSWTATAGTISAAGLFTAPVVSTNTTVTVKATSVAAPSQSASVNISVRPPTTISVTVLPASAVVVSGGPQQFTAAVANTTNQAVNWTATAGTISAAGLFTAPVVSTNTMVTVTATSVAAPSQSASAKVTIQPSVPSLTSFTVSPTSAVVVSGGPQQFTAAVAHAKRKAVTWTATAGIISAAGLFTAPVVSTNTTVTVTATSVAAPSQSASAKITVEPSPSPTLSQTVQHNSGDTPSANSVTVRFRSNVTAGHVLLVAQSTFDAETLNVPADSQGNSFASLVTVDNPGNSVAAIYVATAKSTGADTVTCSLRAGASDNIHCHIYEVSGVTALADAVGSAVPNATLLSVSTSKPSTNGSDYVFAYFASNNTGPTYTAGIGFGDIDQSDSPFDNSGYSDSGFSEDKTVSATGVQTAAATSSVRDSFVGLIVALKNSQPIGLPTMPSCTLSVLPNSGPPPLKVTAIAGCTDPQNDLVSTVISWGDGSSTNGSSGVHTYVNTGSFTVKVTATDSANFTSSVSNTVTATNPVIPAPVSVAVLPVSATVSSGGAQQFTASVAGTTNQAVTWTATVGAVSAAGLFTAPVVSTNATVTVTATSVAAPSQSASATLQVLASSSAPPLSGPITISGQNGTVVENLHITNPKGDCITVTNSSNIIIRRSEIGPCGGNGVSISGGNTIEIDDSYIHPGKPLSTACCDTHDGVFANGTSNLLIQGNVIAYGESNIEVQNALTVMVNGNFLLNPIDSDPSQPADGQSRGQNFQAWSNSRDVTVVNNYALSSTNTSTYQFPENQEDSINFGVSEAIVVQGNYITGGHSPSGCGLIADASANGAQFLNNTLLDTGQCGIGIASGMNQLLDSNRVLNRTPVPGGGNTAIYVWNQYSSACGPVTLSNNVATEIRADATQSGFWNGGGCNPVTLTNDTFDSAAQAQLVPPSQTMPPPQIPPQPKDCVVLSPFTNNTSLPPCR